MSKRAAGKARVSKADDISDIRKTFKLEKASERPTLHREFTTTASVVVSDFLAGSDDLQRLTFLGVEDDKVIRGNVDAIRRHIKQKKLPVAVHKAGKDVYLERVK